MFVHTYTDMRIIQLMSDTQFLMHTLTIQNLLNLIVQFHWLQVTVLRLGSTKDKLNKSKTNPCRTALHKNSVRASCAKRSKTKTTL